jgi:DNA polymerase-3 subunit delta
VKANRAQIERALRAPAATRFFLLHGPDEAGSRALARLVVGGLGPNAERVDLGGSELRSDPARLADEASSSSLFGEPRFILVEATGDEILPAIEALLETPKGGNPVVILAGALKPASRLLKLALADPDVMAFASYLPDEREAYKIVLEHGREHGLRIEPDLARNVAESCGGNRAVIAQEMAKFALFLDAAPDRPRDLQADTVDLLGASSEEGDLSRLVDAVAAGDGAALNAELLRLKSEGMEGIPLARAVLRRMGLLAKLRAEVEQGNSVAAVMASQGKAIFWKEKDSVASQLGRWRADLIAKGVSRLLEAERQAKASSSLGAAAIDEELFAICRQAARLR